MRRDESLDLTGFDVTQLEDLQRKLAEALPGSTLLDVNLEHELLSLMRNGQRLLTDVLHDMDVPANQKSQVINSLASTLDQLSKLQNSIYDSERVKRLEYVFTKTLKSLPAEAAEVALAAYRREWEKQFKK